jgi:microcystin-dependent protein
MKNRRSFFENIWKSPEPEAELRRGFDPYIGEIVLVGFNFAPKGWALCQGQLLNIVSNAALFSILGTTYGGNGTTNFALPDLRGRALFGAGQGPGLTNRDLGETGGAAQEPLITAHLPAHSHAAQTVPTAIVRGTGTQGYGLTTGKDTGTTFSPLIAGAGTAHNNMQPYLVLTYIIATEGVYPPRP